jgi:hypothetical protein
MDRAARRWDDQAVRPLFALSVAACLAGCQTSWKFGGDDQSSSPPPPTTATVTLDQIVRTCAMNFSCFKSPPIGSDCPTTFEGGVLTGDWFVNPADMRRFVDCASSAHDCHSALFCASRGHDPGYCAEHPGVTCDGDILVDCDSSYGGWPILSSDCAALGLQCGASGVSYGCLRAQRSCSPDGSFCGGTWALACSHGQDSSFDCLQLGPQFTCDDSTTGTAVCRATSPVCSDCDAPKGSECKGSERLCNGDSLRLCANGWWRDIPCADFGLKACIGTSGRATCVPTATW